jgi:Sulfotransferase family
MPDHPVKVVYIAGAGRSGTTLLDILIGEREGFFSAGELRWIWWGGLIEGWRCGCGQPLRECPVWNRILTKTYGVDSLEDIDARRFLKLQQATARLHQLPRILAASAERPIRWEGLKQYSDIWNRLYVGISDATGASVIVDSSKNAPEAALLRLCSDVDPYVIHLVRDPRGVANSMKRKVKMEPMAEKTFDQPINSTAISSLIWSRKNLAAELDRLRYPKDRMFLIRYEDVVSRPKETLERISYYIREPLSGLDYVDGNRATLSGNHTSWGNPSRFKTGTIELRPDDEWRTRLAGRDMAISTALTLPLLYRYGFSLGRSSRA